ncbi:MAG: hypothetical protein M1819_007487 [Sarea resinae]|nr:MAG: hypothetical protein M1819_007487 [Sarea resinae]
MPQELEESVTDAGGPSTPNVDAALEDHSLLHDDELYIRTATTAYPGRSRRTNAVMDPESPTPNSSRKRGARTMALRRPIPSSSHSIKMAKIFEDAHESLQAKVLPKTPTGGFLPNTRRYRTPSKREELMYKDVTTRQELEVKGSSPLLRSLMQSPFKAETPPEVRLEQEFPTPHLNVASPLPDIFTDQSVPDTNAPMSIKTSTSRSLLTTPQQAKRLTGALVGNNGLLASDESQSWKDGASDDFLVTSSSGVPLPHPMTEAELERVSPGKSSVDTWLKDVLGIDSSQLEQMGIDANVKREVASSGMLASISNDNFEKKSDTDATDRGRLTYIKSEYDSDIDSAVIDPLASMTNSNTANNKTKQGDNCEGSGLCEKRLSSGSNKENIEPSRAASLTDSMGRIRINIEQSQMPETPSRMPMRSGRNLFTQRTPDSYQRVGAPPASGTFTFSPSVHYQPGDGAFSPRPANSYQPGDMTSIVPRHLSRFHHPGTIQRHHQSELVAPSNRLFETPFRFCHPNNPEGHLSQRPLRKKLRASHEPDHKSELPEPTVLDNELQEDSVAPSASLSPDVEILRKSRRPKRNRRPSYYDPDFFDLSPTPASPTPASRSKEALGESSENDDSTTKGKVRTDLGSSIGGKARMVLGESVDYALLTVKAEATDENDGSKDALARKS